MVPQCSVDGCDAGVLENCSWCEEHFLKKHGNSLEAKTYVVLLQILYKLSK